MTDFESTLHDGLQDAARDVIAHPEFQQRLIDTASAGRSGAGRGSLRSGRFLSTWLLPAAAAVTTMLVAGSVVAAQQLASGRSSTSGDGVMIPATSSSAPAPATVPVTVPPTPAPSTSPSTGRHRSSTTSTRSSSSSTPQQQNQSSSSTATHANPPATSPKTHRSHTRTGAAGPSFPATCSTPDTGEYFPTSLQDFENHMIGTWLVCSEPSIFSTDDAGIQISADGHWARLTRDAQGQLVAGTSSLQKGSWDATDDSAMNGRSVFQINLYIDGSGTIFAVAHLSTGVTRVHLDNNAVYEANYVPTSEAVH